MKDVAAKRWAIASIVNSILLPASAALHFNKAFWVLVITNFVLMHLVWLSQVMRSGSSQKIDFGLFRWPLAVFAALGLLSLLLWERQLLSVLPS